MLKKLIYLSCLVAVLAASSPADTLTFIASGPIAPGMTGSNEFPPNASNGIGSALITWDTTSTTMGVNIVFSGLTGTTTASHIHCCVSPNGTAAVATTVPTFPGFPLGVFGGSYSNSFNMLNAASYNPSFIASHGGTVASAEAALLNGILAGQAYLNIHSTVFPGGEIRGFLVMQVHVSIKPGATAPVPINTRSRGTIPVAILSSAAFNAVTSVDTTSLTFGRTGNEQSLAFCSGGEDVNGDGLADLVCHFSTQLTGLQSGDTSATLKGKTFAGALIIGQEAIVTVP